MQNEIQVYKDIADDILALQPDMIQTGVSSKAEIQSVVGIVRGKLEDFRPKLMVYGIYNAGKSTIINALLGEERAKMGDTPETSVITPYQYGDYELFDTPGLNAPHKHEEVTREHYKKCELIVFVMSNDNVDTNYAYETIKGILDDKKPVVIALNKKQACSDEELKTLEQKIYENIAKLGFSQDQINKAVSVYTINAKSALKGRIEKKINLLNNSGFPAFESKVKDLLNSSGVQEVIKLCNSNIESFIKQVQQNADSKVTDEAIKIAQDAITRMENKKRAKTIDMHNLLDRQLIDFAPLLQEAMEFMIENKQETELVIENKQNNWKPLIDAFLERVRNETIRKVGKFGMQIIDILTSLPQNNHNGIQPILDNFIQKTNQTIDEELRNIAFEVQAEVKHIKMVLDRITINCDVDTQSSEGGNYIAMGLSAALGTAATFAPHPIAKIALAISSVAILALSALLFDKSEERNKAKQAAILEVSNRVNDIVSDLKAQYYKHIDTYINEIFDPIISSLNDALKKQESIDQNICVIKAKLSDINKKLPVLQTNEA